MRPIIKTSLAEAAIEAILRDIHARRWDLGARLPNEATLSGMLGVSRGTVREAVRVLVSQGYLETRQGSGTYLVSTEPAIAPLTMARRASLKDQFETRCALDVEAARLAALRHDDETIRHLRRLLNERGQSDDSPREIFIARDLAFHRAVIAACGNRAMIELYDFFSSSIAETIEATLRQDIPEPDMEAHAAIIDAIASGDPERADRAVRDFMAPVLVALDRMVLS